MSIVSLSLELNNKPEKAKAKIANSVSLVKTGIEELDYALGGGVEFGSSILITGLPGVGKTSFCERFIYEGLKEGKQSCIYFVFDNPIDKIKKDMMKKFRIKEEDVEKITFVDCYSWRTGEDSKSCYAVETLSNMNQIIMVLSDVLRDARYRNKRIVFDSFSTFIIYSDQNVFPRFIDEMIGMLKGHNATSMISVEEGIHEMKIMNFLRFVVDYHFKMEYDYENITLKIDKCLDYERIKKFKIKIKREKIISGLC